MDKVKVPVARILTWPWLASSLHTCGQCVITDYIKSPAQCSRRHGGMAARLQESRAEVEWLQHGGQRLGWLCRQRGPEDGCAGRGPEAETGLLHVDSL